MEQEERWRVLEREAARCRFALDVEGCARAYYEAAASDTYLRSQREHYSSYLFALHYLPGVTAEAMAEQHRVYGRLYPSEQSMVWARPSHKKRRVGFLAPHFCESSSARFYEALMDLPQDVFATYAYSISSEADAFTAQVRAAVAQFRVLPQDDLERAEQMIASDDLDVLVDLGGHTEGGMTLMLLAHHPARRIIEAVGWFDTTGLAAVDELLTDDVMDPAGGESLLTERPLRLPYAWCFTPNAAMRAARGASPAQRGDGTIHLAGFQNFLKLNDALLQMWNEILARVPQAHLHLRDTMQSPERVIALAQRCKALGLPMERVTIEMGNKDYLADLAHMDFVLDTAPYPGGAMTATALYLGVPVLTMRGDTHSRNVGASILTAASLPELIAESPEQYLETAAALARDREKLAALKEKVWEQVPKSALCDTRKYVASWIKMFSA